jgi:hypothetical protein
VRLLVAWDPSNLIYPPVNWYADCRFDGVVEGLGGAGDADTIGNVHALDLNQWVDFSTTVVGHRQGNFLKIDPLFDTLPPGQGVGIGPNQNPTSPVNPALLDNPIRIFQYELFLDGSLGRRDIYGLWLAAPTGEPINFRVWEGIQLPRFATSLVNVPASVTVVPGPGVGAPVMSVAVGVGLRRRRKT